jgi:hypothetical protein
MRYTPHGIGHPTVMREIVRDCADAELMDSVTSEEDENDGDRDNWQGHGIQPCEGDVEQGESDDDYEGGSDDGAEDAEDPDDQEMEDEEGEENDLMSF